MAKRVQKIKGYTDYLPIDEKMLKWGQETVDLIRKNFATQKIFPAGEIYPGWFEENEKRAGTSSWHSTGAGYDSIQFQLLAAADNDLLKLRTLDAIFRYRQYLDYVDLGVGKNRPAGKVQRSREVEHDRQYFNMWAPSSGDTHRPATGPEIRHQVRRLSKYLGHRYADEIEMNILYTLDNLEITL